MIGERRVAAEAQPPSAFSGPRWSAQVALKSPPTIAMGVVVAVRRLQWRIVFTTTPLATGRTPTPTGTANHRPTPPQALCDYWDSRLGEDHG